MSAKPQLQVRQTYTRAFPVLVFLILVSALGVSYSVHLSRQYVGELSQLQRQQDALQVEWEKLLVELNMLTAYNRVELSATRQLGMRPPGAADIRVLDLRRP